jgi:hypothetical protein
MKIYFLIIFYPMVSPTNENILLKLLSQIFIYLFEKKDTLIIIDYKIN